MSRRAQYFAPPVGNPVAMAKMKGREGKDSSKTEGRNSATRSRPSIENGRTLIPSLVETQHPT